MSHIFIGLSLFLLPYPLAYIPTAVLDGLFLYMAVTALNGNQMFERITLLFMEQVFYKMLLIFFHFLNNDSFKGCISAESLHPASSAAEDSPVHWLPSDAAADHVPLRLCTLVLHEDGLPAHHPLPSTRPTSTDPSSNRGTLP